MKEFHFLENDYECPSSAEAIRHSQRRLSYIGFNNDLVDAMKIHYQFSYMEQPEMAAIIFNPNNILVTYSMYVDGSDDLLLHLLEKAGENNIKGITYIDTSGELEEFLGDNIREFNDENILIAKAINSNILLTTRWNDEIKDYELKQVIFHPEEGKRYYIRLVDFDIKNLI